MRTYFMNALWMFKAKNNPSLMTNYVEKYDILYIKSNFVHQQYKFAIIEDCPAL